MLSEVEPEIEGIRKQFILIETEKFRSGFLQSLQQRLKPPDYKSTSAAIGEFIGILKKIDWRSNLLVNLILQMFFVWDLRLVISLNEWKRKNRNQFKDWFGVIAEMEVAVSLASLIHNEPDWCFPEVDDKYFHFAAEQIGHPLLPVDNPVYRVIFPWKELAKLHLLPVRIWPGSPLFSGHWGSILYWH